MGRIHPLILYRFVSDKNDWCNSPFVNKLDALLTFSGAKFVNNLGSISRAPRGQFPFIRLEERGLIPDSELAYNTCVQENVVKCLDMTADLTPKEKATSIAIRSLVERSLVELEIHERWILNYYETRDVILPDVPTLLRPLIAYWFIYRVISWRMSGSIMKLTSKERQRNLEEFVEALANFIPSSGWILGKNAPTRVDATVFGFLASAFAYPTLSPSMVAELHKHKNIIDYTRRISIQYWPERPPLV